jgi:uncharacterized membrane protein
MLNFWNAYGKTVNVAIMYYRPNCPDGGDWIKKGWWVLQPGQSKVPYGGNLSSLNRYFLYVAEAVDGRFWAGEFVRNVPGTRAFELCEHTSTTDSRPAGFRLLDIGGNVDYTVTLIP